MRPHRAHYDVIVMRFSQWLIVNDYTAGQSNKNLFALCGRMFYRQSSEVSKPRDLGMIVLVNSLAPKRFEFNFR